ncbi:MAG: response regulator [Candidatus Moraniibacteriota bacterium]|jgi:two-component SAPR family response regulator
MKILVVDDEAFGTILSMMLEDLFPACCIDVASSPREAFEYLESYPYDVVISDFNLGADVVPNGIGILLRAKEINSAIVAILMSAEDIRVEAIKNLGVDCFLKKPIEMELIKKKIQNFRKRS